MVMARPSGNGNAAYYCLGIDQPKGVVSHGSGVSQQWQFYDGTSLLTSGETLDTALHLLVIKKTGTSYNLRRDGVSKATGTLAAVALNDLRLNGRDDAAPWTGGSTWGELIVYNAALSGGDLTTLEAAVMTAWGI